MGFPRPEKRICRCCNMRYVGIGFKCPYCATKSQLKVTFPTSKQPHRPWPEMIGPLYKTDEMFRIAVDEFILLVKGSA